MPDCSYLDVVLCTIIFAIRAPVPQGRYVYRKNVHPLLSSVGTVYKDKHIVPTVQKKTEVYISMPKTLHTLLLLFKCLEIIAIYCINCILSNLSRGLNMLKTSETKRIESSLKMTFLISCCILILLNIGCCVSTARFEAMRKRADESEKQRNKVTEELKLAKLALYNARRDLSAALNKLKLVEKARDQAIARLKIAASNLEEAEATLQIANRNLATAITERDTARKLAKITEDAKVRAETERDTAQRLAKIAEDAKMRAETTKKRAETERDTAQRLAKIAEDAKMRAETTKKRFETERDTARRLAKIAEDAKVRFETERDTARRLAKIAENRAAAAEAKVSLVPQATITNVRIAEKKKDIDILVTFSIKNRKNSKGLVIASFYFANGQPLRNRNGPISISEEFTPKQVNEKERTVKLSMSYAELNIAQPSKLQFRFRIYDKSTEKFLDGKPYLKPFSFNPHKN